MVSQAFRLFFGDEYLLLDVLGRGATGVVHKAKKLSNGDTFALKEINTRKLNFNAKSEIDKEMQLMKDLRWPTVIWRYDVWDSGDSRLRYVLMPIMEGGALADRAKAVKW